MISNKLGLSLCLDISNKPNGEILPIGKGRIVRQGNGSVAFFTLGTMLHSALIAAKDLQSEGVDATVADARFAKPLDLQLIKSLVQSHDVLVLVEEGARGGFGAHALQQMAMEGLLDGPCKVRTFCMPDRYIDHMTQAQQLEEAGLTAERLKELALNLAKPTASRDAGFGGADVLAGGEKTRGSVSGLAVCGVWSKCGRWSSLLGGGGFGGSSV